MSEFVAKGPGSTRRSGARGPERMAPIIALLAAGATAAGLLAWPGSEAAAGPASFTSVRGDVVELFGSGLYRFDSLLAGAGHRGTDAVTLLLALPLLLLTARAFARGSVRAGVAYLGALGWFLYAYGGYALGVAAYNEAFLVYVALFGASLFAFVATFRHLEGALRASQPPRRVRGLGAFMLLSAVATFVIWMIDPLTALIARTQPVALAGYSTLFTYALDLAVVAPAAALAAFGLYRGAAWAWLLAGALLTLEALLAPMIAAQTVSQLAAGVRFTLAEALGPIAGFVALSLAAAWFLYELLRSIPKARERRADAVGALRTSGRSRAAGW